MFSSIVNRLQDVVTKYPEKIAIQTDDYSCSYKQLWEQISICSSYLTANGLKTGDRVGLLVNNSIEYIASYYGIISSGGIVVALNTMAKSSDIVNWIDHSGANYIIFDSDLNITLHKNNFLKIIDVNTKSNRLEGFFWSQYMTDYNIDLFQPLSIAESALVSIIYTSGTTGQPKGVMLTHKNFISNLSEVINYLGLTSKDIILNILPFYYSYGNSVLHTHLLVGATIIIENNFMYPAKTLKKIVDYKVTGFSGVPATFAILLNRINIDEYDLSHLRYVTQAGGPMPPSNIRKFVEKVDHIKFFVMYGQTEATARLTYLNPEMLFEKPGSVGKPLNGINIQIRDKNNNILDSNTEGELFVKGPNIMSGYWDNQNLTKQVIIDDYLKTGDLGYIDPEGYIFLTGRLSDMIKVGGNRISPLEVEEVVIELDGIEEVVATGVEDDILGQVVKLTIIRNKDNEITEKMIKAYCRKNLALYKVPKYINFVEVLPKTASGKIKRFLL